MNTKVKIRVHIMLDTEPHTHVLLLGWFPPNFRVSHIHTCTLHIYYPINELGHHHSMELYNGTCGTGVTRNLRSMSNP